MNKPILNQHGIPYIIELDKGYGDIPNITTQALQEGYREQTYRHITVVGGKTVEKIKNVLDKLDEDAKKEIIAKIVEKSNSLDWNFKLSDVYKISQTGCFREDGQIEDRKSYIRLTDMPDMNRYYITLNNLLNLNLPTQFPHITLFTKGEKPNPDFYGIPIPSKQAFESMGPKKIEI